MGPEIGVRTRLSADSARKRAALLIGHGSRKRGFADAMKRVARRLERTGEYDLVACAYLEIAPPSIAEAVARLGRLGAREIRVLPYFLQSGKHVREDLPREVAKAARNAAGANVKLCPYLGFDESLVALSRRRLRQA